MPHAISAQQVRQHQRVTRIGLRTRHRVAVAIAIHRLRIDREHPIPRSYQRRDQQTTIGLQRHLHPSRRRGQAGQRAGQPAKPRHVITDPELGQHRALGIDHRDVVVMLGPIDPDEDSHCHYLLNSGEPCEPGA